MLGPVFNFRQKTFQVVKCDAAEFTDGTKLCIFTRWHKTNKIDYVWNGDNLPQSIPHYVVHNPSLGAADYRLLFYINNIFEGNYDEFEHYISTEINKERVLITLH